MKRVAEIFEWHVIFLCGLLRVEGRRESLLKYCEIFILTLLNNFLMAVRKEEIRQAIERRVTLLMLITKDGWL